VAKKLKANAVSGYSNDSNPFGDPNLTEKYVNSFPSHMKLCSNSVILVIWGKDFGSNLRLSGEKKKNNNAKIANNHQRREKPKESWEAGAVLC